MNFKKIFIVNVSPMIAAVMMVGCCKTKDNLSTNSTEENYNTCDEKLDNVRNENYIGEKELLVISFGTSFTTNCHFTIGAIENDLETAIPDYSVRRSFTSNTIINKIQNRDGLLIDDVETSMRRAVDNNVKILVIQPTHLMNGIEYDEIVEKVINNYADNFEKIVFSAPLLTSDNDFLRVEKAIVDWTSEYNNEETAICFVGHGTEHIANSVYTKMQEFLELDGYSNYFIGTVESEPTLEFVLKKIKKGGYKKVVIEPLMVVAGKHANDDIAGDKENSWKSLFEAEGIEVECLMRGLGENEKIREIYIDHAKTAIYSLSQS